mmetsp:Transcript_17607/g.52896  ORF Transcript_17607/g.52896 Transcript_17607/m.52896 type:complete len:191 (+) Transcript_17607:117-689(+)|eukprot:CAMPEP_0206148666 /NCGR_PEP_ID=MMETSP1473-20131121/37279_1 /ASSEMBLY_ACC=CAM_ASM_001109 /TAXON_ID=1461547 /ORGANISM="Stichococcus sp, Strain RCC1054" /LENGTH=190 /DNA_ID=CAMNT_0053546077 /DNA_START=103 /DNA_END=675 /DNA_ORIENTATION=+
MATQAFTRRAAVLFTGAALPSCRAHAGHMQAMPPAAAIHQSSAKFHSSAVHQHSAALGSPRQLMAIGFPRGSSSAPRVRGVATSALVDDVRQKNEDNKVIVYSKTWCPYCAQVKQLFAKLEVDAKIVELDQVVEGDDVQEALYDISGMRTVPQVFIGGELIGGGDDTMMAHNSGDLEKKLANVGITAKKL